ncbi:MAG: DUF3368 domain-containing protein [Patescibacteria group bacterium]|nr:DUF3368 domain-containing protein [Patescibacteria group bacterium]
MPEVVADTSPLQYLHCLGLLDLLRQWYGTVSVPMAVLHEIEVGAAQGANVPSIRGLPWIRVEAVSDAATGRVMTSLGRGERESIGLALTKLQPLLILDDRTARCEAQRLSLRCTGTAGVLIRAKREAIVGQLAPLLDDLRQHGFYLDAKTRAHMLRLAGETC